MTVSRIQNQVNLPPSTGTFPKSKIPQGLAETRDRLENRRHEEPPSIFKEFLFRPAWEVIKFMMRGIFIFLDFLRRVAFEGRPEQPALDREDFLNCLKRAPRPEKLLLQFRELYSTAEQNRVYRAIGEAHAFKISWKEVIWDRTPNENIDLGRLLVRENPFLLRDHLI
jgi:hypothetical protein